MKEARSSHSSHPKDESAHIAPYEHIAEHAHEIRAIGHDSNLHKGE